MIAGRDVFIVLLGRYFLQEQQSFGASQFTLRMATSSHRFPFSRQVLVCSLSIKLLVYIWSYLLLF